MSKRKRKFISGTVTLTVAIMDVPFTFDPEEETRDVVALEALMDVVDDLEIQHVGDQNVEIVIEDNAIEDFDIYEDPDDEDGDPED